MPRWEVDPVGRLQAAAFDLFVEQGYERTTVAEIAERAGLTRRTFFYHFPDKREVFFGVVDRLGDIATREIENCAASIDPLHAVLRGLQVIGDELFEGRRDVVVNRQRIVDATPELSEREAAKQAALTGTVAAALRTRGVEGPSALLTAQIGDLLLKTGMRTWLAATDATPLRQHFTDALATVRDIVSSVVPGIVEGGLREREHTVGGAV